MGYGYDACGLSSFSVGVFKLVFFVLGTFIFSVIFWWTHNWMSVEYKKKKRK